MIITVCIHSPNKLLGEYTCSVTEVRNDRVLIETAISEFNLHTEWRNIIDASDYHMIRIHLHKKDNTAIVTFYNTLDILIYTLGILPDIASMLRVWERVEYTNMPVYVTHNNEPHTIIFITKITHNTKN